MSNTKYFLIFALVVIHTFFIAGIWYECGLGDGLKVVDCVLVKKNRLEAEELGVTLKTFCINLGDNL